MIVFTLSAIKDSDGLVFDSTKGAFSNSSKDYGESRQALSK